MMTFMRPTLSLLVGFTLVLGVAFPLLFVGIGQVAFPYQANGSMITVSGKPVGSAIIGQNFTRPIYFHGRVSALTGTDAKGKTIPTPYDASESGASNLAPTSAALHDRVKGDAAMYGAPVIPGDAVTSSGSGLDPDISLENASLQAARVAAARHVSTDQVSALVAANTTGRLFGIFGEPRVNVLQLNLALDQNLPGR
jgi:K+-transporting ATPase ATPase C chain